MNEPPKCLHEHKKKGNALVICLSHTKMHKHRLNAEKRVNSFNITSEPLVRTRDTQDRSFLGRCNTPSTMDRFQIVVRSGSNMSTCSCRSNVGRRSSSHDFGVAAMIQRSSAAATSVTADRPQVVDGHIGG